MAPSDFRIIQVIVSNPSKKRRLLKLQQTLINVLIWEKIDALQHSLLQFFSSL